MLCVQGGKSQCVTPSRHNEPCFSEIKHLTYDQESAHTVNMTNCPMCKWSEMSILVMKKKTHTCCK